MTIFIIILFLLSVAGAVYLTIRLRTEPEIKPLVIILYIVSVLCLFPLFFSSENRVTVVAGMFMIASFAGMLFCARKQQVYANAQPLAIALFVVVMFCGASILYQTMGSGYNKMLDIQMKYMRSAAYVLGKFVSEKYPNSEILVLINENYEKNKYQVNALDGLKEGLALNDCTVKLDYIERSSSEEEEMMLEAPSAKEFDSVINRNTGCKAIVSFYSLPYDVGEMEIWQMAPEERPMFLLFFGEIMQLRNAIRAGYIAALSYKPDAVFDEEYPPDDPQEAFNKRYVILNSENVDDSKYRDIFPKED